jgi:hypothetical protein
MKKMVFLIAMLVGTTSAFAQTHTAKVCSIGRTGQVYTTEFKVEGAKVTMDQDGTILDYDLISASPANLKRASAISGEAVVEATQYVISSPQGTTTLQIAVGKSGGQYMIFPDTGILGATTENCN